MLAQFLLYRINVITLELEILCEEAVARKSAMGNRSRNGGNARFSNCGPFVTKGESADSGEAIDSNHRSLGSTRVCRERRWKTTSPNRSQVHRWTFKIEQFYGLLGLTVVAVGG